MSTSQRDAIRAFWTWWATNEQRLEDDLHDASASWIPELTAHVKAIHADLDWEFGPGVQAQHHLCLSSRGDPRVRVAAERWRAAGPGDGETFEFHTARQPVADPNVMVDLGDARFAFSELQVQVVPVEHRHRFDVTVYHPAFATLPEATSDQLLWLALDNLLGEDAVETWLGGVERGAGPPPEDAVSVGELRDLVANARQRWPEETGTVLQGTDPETGQPVLFNANLTAKYLDHWAFDTLYCVRIPYREREDGMPIDRAEYDRVSGFAEQAEQLENVLSLCRQTGLGERVEHYYVRGENAPARRALDALVESFDGRVEVTVAWDPGWRRMPI